MSTPIGTHSATVSLGYINPGDGEKIYYLGSYYNSSCYSFYRGSARWIAISQFPGSSVIVPEGGAMFKSTDDGATWTLIGGISPSVSSVGAYTSPAYDVGFATFDGVGRDPNTETKITVIGNLAPGDATHYTGFFADFNFNSETWGDPYSSLDQPTITIHAQPTLSSIPAGGYAYSLIGVIGGGPPNFITVGATVVGTSPWLIIDAVGHAHVGDESGKFSVGDTSAGNVRIHGGSLVFAQASAISGHMEVLTRPVGSSTWTVETISSLDGLYDDQPPWMSSPTDLFYIGADHKSIYLTQKTAGVWGTPVSIWSLATDANPDLSGVVNGRTYQLIASCNPILGGLDITFEFDPSGTADAMFTFHLPPSGAGWSDLDGGCSDSGIRAELLADAIALSDHVSNNYSQGSDFSDSFPGYSDNVATSMSGISSPGDTITPPAPGTGVLPPNIPPFQGGGLSTCIFEFYEMQKPEDVEVLPVPKRFDQLGPMRFDKIGKIFALRIRLIMNGTTTSLPFAIYGDDSETSPHLNSPLYSDSFPVRPGFDNIYEIQLPKSVNTDIFRLTLGPVADSFHRYNVIVKVHISGMQGQAKWLPIR